VTGSSAIDARRAELLGSLAHELRSPIATIKGLAATIRAHGDRLTDDEKAGFVEQIEHEAGRMLVAVNQATLAMRLDAGVVSIDPQPHDVVDVVRDGVAAAMLGARTVDIDAPEPVEGKVDAQLLAEAVHQLVSNAGQFSSPIDPITVRVRRDRTDALIEVIDEGPGVPADRRDAVFEPFTTWRPQGFEGAEGLGLGLFISRGIATLLGGEISLGDGPSGGTMTRVRVPLEG
jgi:two-component system sensor histidine kinase KdpD